MRDFHLPGRSPVLAMNGMVATSHPLAARVGVDILAQGGSAADAAIAGAILLGLCEPQMTGLGGDCFVLVKPAGSEEVEALNGSGRAPSATDPAALRAAGHATVPVDTPDAVTLPGAVDAFCTLSERHGKLGLDAVLAPVIPYFEQGVPVAPRVAHDWAEAQETLKGSAREVYLPWGKAPTLGARFALPGQAEVLRRLAKEGRAGFYEGEVAEDMVAALRAAGGCHTAEDFAATACDWTTPISGPVMGANLVEHPPNGQGATALLMANILTHFDIAGLDPFGAQRAHLEAEAAKLAYDARNRFLADPDHTARLDHMLAPETAARLAALIDPKRAMDAPAALSEQVHKDTIYITAVDRDGMAVSLIYSIFHSFGSGLASDKFGILFQNRGAGFTLEAGHPNEMGPGKRPMHTIIPAMLKEDGRVTMPFGVMGGQYQSNGHVRFVSNMREFGMDAQSAIDAPRSFADGGVLRVERGYSDAVRAALSDMGHTVEVPVTAIGGAQAIRIDAGGWLEGASDPRKDGCALGY
ncbi:gamma-glutamyltransferase family protein [Jannaschia seohaensis]|uniref:Gamma-glutamyltranspeptidase / glutathione hydrolase n=1 Tax=Jannaschia seohaensis TaxID=475081 RepID=A0A2Y9B183_9RHOB|nr:gamma-glutamyltransferase family protein [Jannaschia seohaensis]PWJ14493.1 gamma-glutamyltranspeptidase/glutathione hydrolase [Jannaschia seohaensis]SSA50254.1 gamma-glutamyltranspeptidase / glutathione hydrolase [Jannaschia seohaensis]